MLTTCAASTVVALGVGATPAFAAEPVKIAITNWADVLATANLAKYVLETELNQPVKFVQANIGVQYQGVARGDLDIMVGGWLPVTHRSEEHTSELQSLLRISYAVFCLKKNNTHTSIRAHINDSE